MTKLNKNGLTECCNVKTERSFTAEGYIEGKTNCTNCGEFIETL